MDNSYSWSNNTSVIRHKMKTRCETASNFFFCLFSSTRLLLLPNSLQFMFSCFNFLFYFIVEKQSPCHCKSEKKSFSQLVLLQNIRVYVQPEFQFRLFNAITSPHSTKKKTEKHSRQFNTLKWKSFDLKCVSIDTEHWTILVEYPDETGWKQNPCSSLKCDQFSQQHVVGLIMLL